MLCTHVLVYTPARIDDNGKKKNPTVIYTTVILDVVVPNDYSFLPGIDLSLTSHIQHLTIGIKF